MPIKALAQSEYAQSLIERTTKEALRDPAGLLFDPQGRVLIDIKLSDDDKELFKEIFGRDPASVTTVSLDITNNPELNTLYKAQYGLEDQISRIRGSIIPLHQEFHSHLALAARTYTAVNKDHFPPEKMAEAHQNAIKRVHDLVTQEFKNALQRATDETGHVNDVKLVQELDKARKKISPDAHQILMEEVFHTTGQRLNKEELKGLKHLAETTTATPNDLLHTDHTLGLATWIAGSEVTAHDRGKGAEHLADRQIVTMILDADNQTKPIARPRLQIRTPSLDVKKGISEQDAIIDVSEKLAILNEKYTMGEVLEGNPLGTKAFTYNLHTAINDTVDDLQGKNKQSRGARIILSGAHKYNALQLGKEPPVFCFVQNISVNGFGDSLGYGGNKLRTEATLMTEMAMLYNLVAKDDPQKKQIEAVFAKYTEYLRNPSREPFFSESNEGKKAIELIQGVKAQWAKEVRSPSQDPVEKAKNALKTIMAHDLHHQHQYAKLTQALSIFIEEASISGCKSGNERAQAINGRVAVLDSSVGKDEDELMQAIDQLATANPDNVADVKAAIDGVYDHHLHSAAAMVSYVDQGAAAKVNAKVRVTDFKSFLAQFNRNYAEEATLSHLQQSKASAMQAHKGLTEQMSAVVTASEPKEEKPGFIETIVDAGKKILASIQQLLKGLSPFQRQKEISLPQESAGMSVDNGEPPLDIETLEQSARDSDLKVDTTSPQINWRKTPAHSSLAERGEAVASSRSEAVPQFKAILDEGRVQHQVPKEIHLPQQPDDESDNKISLS